MIRLLAQHHLRQGQFYLAVRTARLLAFVLAQPGVLQEVKDRAEQAQRRLSAALC